MDPNHNQRIKLLREKAEEVRTASERMHDEYARDTMMRLAASYTVMAAHLELRETQFDRQKYIDQS